MFTRYPNSAFDTKYMHDEPEDCYTKPMVTVVLPALADPAGDEIIAFKMAPNPLFGRASGESQSIAVNGLEFLSTTLIPGTAQINATSRSSAGQNLPIQVTVDGILADGVSSGQTHQVNFSYRLPPVIMNITAPPANGGTMKIYGVGFGNDQDEIKVTVMDQGCPRDCPGVELLTHPTKGDYVQCQYRVVGVFGDCNGTAAVVVKGQESEFVAFCYQVVASGELVNVPSTRPRLKEGGVEEYQVWLTEDLPPNNPVQITLSIENTTSMAQVGLTCTVSPNTIVVPAYDTFDAIAHKFTIRVITGNNDVDEGANELVYSCKVLHKIESQDEQYTNAPSRILTVDVINDDKADLKIWIYNEMTHSYDFSV
jgi:hypothetical protein